MWIHRDSQLDARLQPYETFLKIKDTEKKGKQRGRDNRTKHMVAD